jgi:hypothetical protein
MPIVKFNPDYYPQPDAGRPISAGFIYIGEPGTDPEDPENQKIVYALETGEIIGIPEYLPIAQPIRTNAGGVPISINNKPVILFVSGDYSCLIKDMYDQQKYYIPTNLGAGEDEAIDKLSDYNCNLGLAVNTIGSVKKTHLIIDCIPDDLTADVTVSKNIVLEWKKGCVIAGPFNLIIEGPVMADHYQLFDTTVTVFFNSDYQGEVKAFWFGDLFVDTGAAVNKAITSRAKDILLPVGDDFIQITEILLDNLDGVTLRGSGKLSTIIKLNEDIKSIQINDSCDSCKIEKFKVLVIAPVHTQITINIGGNQTLSEIEVDNGGGIGISCNGVGGCLHNITAKNTTSYGISFNYGARYWKLSGTNLINTPGATGFNTYESAEHIEVNLLIIQGCGLGALIRGNYSSFKFIVYDNTTRGVSFAASSKNNRLIILDDLNNVGTFNDSGEKNRIDILSEDKRYPEDYYLKFYHRVTGEVDGGSIIGTTPRPIIVSDPVNASDGIPGFVLNKFDHGTDPNTFIPPKGKYKIKCRQVFSSFDGGKTWIKNLDAPAPGFLQFSLTMAAWDSGDSPNLEYIIECEFEANGTDKYRIESSVNQSSIQTYNMGRSMSNTENPDPNNYNYYMETTIKKLK